MANFEAFQTSLVSTAARGGGGRGGGRMSRVSFTGLSMKPPTDEELGLVSRLQRVSEC